MSNTKATHKKSLFNLNAWNPTEADRMGIVRELLFDYSNMIQGASAAGLSNSEDARKARERLDRIMELPLAECKDEIQEQFIWFWSNWDGNVEDAAAGDPERAALYRRILGLYGEAT